MTITANESALLEQRETVLTNAERNVVSNSLDEIDFQMKATGIKPAGDDRAARLEAAIIRFIIESKAS